MKGEKGYIRTVERGIISGRGSSGRHRDKNMGIAKETVQHDKLICTRHKGIAPGTVGDLHVRKEV